MKISVLLLCIVFVFAGCATATYETIGHVEHVSATLPPLRQTLLEFPEDAMLLTGVGEDTLYTCEDYTISMQVFPAGDFAGTVTRLSGYDPEQLTIVESKCGDHTRYEWVFSAAGENGDAICRAALLDDGDYHYTLCVEANAKDAGKLTQAWNALFASFCLGIQE